MYSFTTVLVFIIMSVAADPSGATFTVETAIPMDSVEECLVQTQRFNEAAAEDAIEKNPDASAVPLEYEAFCTYIITGWEENPNA